jgi:predicted HTH transcriptional regulator
MTEICGWKISSRKQVYFMDAEQEYYISLIERLRQLPEETEWVEFKVDNRNPELIGEYISALSNSATIWNKEKAYVLWGIDNDTHEIKGTSFAPRSTKKGNEEIENWLAFETKPFELRVAMKNVTASKVTELLDCAAYYTLMKLPLPSNRDSIIHNMTDEEFVREMDNGNYEITNMGALLLAKDLSAFSHLKRKAVRVIRYKGNGKTNAIREQVFTKGYAIQFDDITDYIMTLIPQEEEIDGGRRQEHIMFPRKAIREMLGNMIIHQDLTVHGSGPIMEIFDTKVEASNPGSLLVEVNRIIDTVPHSRNESMASFLRIVRICEERGSGFDRMEEGMRDLLIPAPKVETGEDFTRTKLYWYGKLNAWTKEDKIRTCYLYTCYCYVNEIEVANAVLRDRFGIEEKNKAVVSRIIKDTMDAGLLKLSDENAAPKMRRYIPYWA